jgi:anthranilate/para-aminobenzoate synthase component I
MGALITEVAGAASVSRDQWTDVERRQQVMARLAEGELEPEFTNVDIRQSRVPAGSNPSCSR